MKPSYAPRKIIKESVDNIKEVVYKIENEEDAYFLMEKLKENNIKWQLHNFFNESHNEYYKYPAYAFFNIRLGMQTFIFSLKNEVANLKDLNEFIYDDKSIYKPVFTISNINYMINIIKAKKFTPSYAPRKIIKEFSEFILK
jgi:hypothetical protein